MHKKKNYNLAKRFAAASIFPITVFSGFALYSRIRYKRSPGATIVEHLISKKLGHILHTPQSTGKYLHDRSLVEEERYTLPVRNYKSTVCDTSIEGCQTILFEGSGHTERIILYIHGGGYAGQMTKYHVAFCDTLAKKANATIAAPIYPLAPNHTYRETYAIIKRIYLSIQKENKPVILAGDSAGGGFVSAFCQYLHKCHIEQPDKLILISPWVDISMSGNGYEHYETADPLLKVDGLVVMGKAWAGDTDTRDYRLSPLFGDVDCLPPTLLFVGTREVFYPDILAFYNKFTDKTKVELVVGTGMDHVYPIYPILEARKAMKQTIAFIR